MNKELTISPFLINHQPHPNPKSWVKLLTYEPTNPEVLATRGKMYAILSLASQIEIDFTPHMQLIIETLQQRYFGVTQGGILQTLEITLDAIQKQLILAGQQDKRLSAGFSFDILVTVNWGTVLYIGKLGSSGARLMRQGKLYELEDPSKTNNLYVSSGVVQAGDRFFLATGQLLSKFNQKQLLNTLSLPSDTLLPCIEQSVDHQPGSLESGFLLTIDIKQVPSLQQEGLHIKDADLLSVSGLRTAAQNSSVSAGKLWSGINQKFQSLRQWHIAGKIPGLPLAIIVVCILGLTISIGFKYWKPANHQTTVDVSDTVAQLQDQFTQASQLAAINPDRAQDLLDQLLPALAQAQSISSDNRLDNLAAQAQQLQNTLLNIQTLNPHPIGDATAISDKLTLSGNQLYFVNQQHQLIQLAQNQLKAIANNTQLFTDSSYLTATTNGLVVMQSQQATLLSYSGQEVGSVSTSLGQIISGSSYQQNAYALNQAGQLLRLATQANVVNDPTNYFTAAQPQVRDVAIDGDVYALLDNGTVQKYTSGEVKPFALERPNLAQGGRAIFTTVEDDNLYILGDHQFLVWSKDGQYVGQYQLSQNAKWQAAAVDVINKTLYILSEGKLIEAQLP
jgi:hypothetical protein